MSKIVHEEGLSDNENWEQEYTFTMIPEGMIKSVTILLELEE